jgi:hypothetical protein
MSGEQSISIERSRLGKELGEGVEREEKKGEGSEVMGEGQRRRSVAVGSNAIC